MARIVGNMVGVPNPQSDWNQIDATKADYIKNRPFYYEEGNQYTILEERVVEFSFYRELGNKYMPSSSPITVPYNCRNFGVDKKYKMTFDDTEYVFVCKGITIIDGSNDLVHLKCLDPECPVDLNMEILPDYEYIDIYIQTDALGSTHDIKIVEDDSVLVQLDEIFIPNSISRVEDVNKSINEAISSLPSGGGESISYNDLTDKPCYDVVSYESFFNNPTQWFVEDGDRYWVDLLSLSRPVEPAVGKKYKVVFDGIDYELECVSYDESNLYSGADLRGNESCPFTVRLYNSMGTLPIQEVEIYTTLPGYTHSVEMFEVVYTAVPLDDRYIPDSIARVDYVNSKLDDKSDKVHTHSYNDLTDKPLYDDANYAEFYSLQSVDFYDNGNNVFASYIMAMRINNDFIPSENYRVMFDGTPYDMKCESISATAYKLVSVDSACPLEVVMNIVHWENSSEIEFEFYTTTPGDTHDVEIFEIIYIPVPLDEKYIPDSIARVEDVNNAIGDIDKALDSILAIQEMIVGGVN